MSLPSLATFSIFTVVWRLFETDWANFLFVCPMFKSSSNKNSDCCLKSFIQIKCNSGFSQAKEKTKKRRRKESKTAATIVDDLPGWMHWCLMMPNWLPQTVCGQQWPTLPVVKSIFINSLSLQWSIEPAS